MKIRIRRLLVPVFLCLAVACLVEIPLGQTDLFGEEVILWDTLFRTIAAMPGLIYFYREDRVFRGKAAWGLKEGCLCAVLGAGLSLAAGAVVSISKNLDYKAAGETLLTGRLWLQALVLLLASPLLEEFFFRGILYQRLKELVSPAAAAVISAAIFGLYHGNISQGIYGFFMGLCLAYSMEKCQTVKAPCAMHFAANLAAFAASALNLP